MCLLLVMHRLGYHIEAAHCNFHLRQDESNRDEAFVINLCKQLNIELHLIHFDTETYAKTHKISIEMAARELRYNYFEQLRRDICFDGICVAHHQDDSVETILLNLIRGTGVHGLTGIKPRNGNILRPLLCVSKSDITKWLNIRIMLPTRPTCRPMLSETKSASKSCHYSEKLILVLRIAL